MQKFRVLTDLHIRQRPDKTYDSGAQVLKAGTIVEKFDYDQWYYVKTQLDGAEVVGWVSNKSIYLEPFEGTTPLPPSGQRFNKEARRQYVDSILQNPDKLKFTNASRETWDSVNGKPGWIHGYSHGGYATVVADWKVSQQQGRLEIIEGVKSVSEQDFNRLFSRADTSIHTYCNFNVSYCYKAAYGGPNLQSPDGRHERTANELFIKEFMPNWKQVEAADAAKIANEGGFVVASWPNPSGRSGHVVFLLEESKPTGNLSDLQCFHVGGSETRQTNVRESFKAVSNLSAIKLFVDQATYNEWFKITPPSDGDNHLEQFNTDSDLKKRPSPLTTESIDEYFRRKEKPLVGIGAAVIAASDKYDINATYIVAHAIVESGWGTSRIAQDKNNLFGWSAEDDDPYNKAMKFASKAECIDFVMGKINDLYLNPTGRYFSQKACLGNGHYGMSLHYASDHGQWAEGIAQVARQLERDAV